MRVIICVDGSSEALIGAEIVAALPLSDRDEVIVASIAQRPILLGAWAYTQGPATDGLLDAAWDAEQERAAGAAREGTRPFTTSPFPVRSVVREGDPADTLPILVEEMSADLIVVGPRGRGRLESLLLGSVSHALLQTMPTSVLVARGPGRAPRRVLLATDGSDWGRAAATYLARFPLPPDCRIDVLTVVDSLGSRLGGRDSADLAGLGAMERQHATQILDSTIEVLRGGGRTAEPHIRHGDPKREILDAAGTLSVDLVVTGARGAGSLRRTLLGGVSGAVSAAARCSALVVAHGPEGHA